MTLGEECYMREDGSANCQVGLVCDASIIPDVLFATGQCKSAFSLALGEPTTSDDLCASGLSSQGLCVTFPSDALSYVGQFCADSTDCTAVGTCVCTMRANANTQVCQLKNEYFLQQPGMRAFYNQLVDAISTHKCHFSLEPDESNCFMREFPTLGSQYYCAQWLSNFHVTDRLLCDSTITDWCALKVPEISGVDPVNSLLLHTSAGCPRFSLVWPFVLAFLSMLS